MGEVLLSEFLTRSEPEWQTRLYERMEQNTSSSLFPIGVLIVGALIYLFMPAWLALILALLNLYDCVDTFHTALRRYGMSAWRRYALLLGSCTAIIYTCYRIPARWRYLAFESILSNGLFGCGSAILRYCEGSGTPRREVSRLWFNGIQVAVRPAGAVFASQWSSLFNAFILWSFTSRLAFMCVLGAASGVFYRCSNLSLLSWRYHPLVEAVTDLWYEGDAWIYHSYIQWKRRAIVEQTKRKSAACTDNYVHDLIRPGQIRLLILPRSAPFDNTPICGTLRSIDLDKPPPYQTLSYCWGSGALSAEIFIDGKRLRVTQSVSHFLIEKRSCFRETHLWIDAVCIDQQSLPEKSHQVAQMSEVYKRATKTVAYMGDKYEARMCVPLLYETPLLETLRAEAPYYLEKLRSRRSTTRWRAMTWLLNNQYFRRSWIVQEVALSPNLVFHIGGRSTTLSDLKRAMESVKRLDVVGSLQSLEKHDDKVRSAYIGLGSINNVFRLRADASMDGDPLEKAHERHLSGLVFMLATLDATDPRDKLYAALGLANDYQFGGQLDPDYCKTTAAVMKALSEHLLIHQASPFLQALALAGHGYSGRDSAYPSWVVRPVEPARPGYSITKSWHAHGFNAGNKRQIECRLGSSKQALLLRGVLCDKIKSVTRAQLWDLTRSECFELHELRHILAARAAYLDDIFKLLAHEGLPFDEQGRTRLALVLMGYPTQAFLEPEPNTGPHFSNLVMDYYNGLYKKPAPGTKIQRLSTSHKAIGSEQVVLTEFRDNRFMNHFLRACGGRSFAITESGRFALVPPQCQQGDEVFVPFGGQTPLLIRSTSTNTSAATPTFGLLGEMFLEAAMRGQLVTHDAEGELIALV